MCRRQALLKIASARENGTFAYLVISQPRYLLSIELSFPGKALLGESITQ